MDQEAVTAAAGEGLALGTRGLTKRFGGLVAVDALTMEVPRGQIRGLIGPNGSGKTTTVNVLSGLYRPDGGEIHLCGQRTDRLHCYVAAGRLLDRTSLGGGLSCCRHRRLAQPAWRAVGEGG